jgi:uncharacterized protein YdeI (YjbR/CyaY-like superfamily)
MGELPIRSFANAAAWAAWLAKHHDTSTGLWLKIAKKGSGEPSITYGEALDEALCWGWIDGQKQTFDDVWWLQRFTPRGPRSIWSTINRDKVAALTAAGRMQPAGALAVERARADGRWDDAYAPQSKAVVPDDLAAALATNARAARFFATLDATNRYAVLHRVHTAKKPETRARRIADFVAMLARGETLYPARAKKPARAATKQPARTAKKTTSTKKR